MEALQIEELFSNAYRLAHEESAASAIELCDRILEEVPSHHNAQMLKGCLLGDSPRATDTSQARDIFRSAVRLTGIRRDEAEWPEENPLYQLAISFHKNAESRAAVAAYAIDYVLNGTPGSRTELLDLLADESDAATAIAEVLDLASSPVAGVAGPNFP